MDAKAPGDRVDLIGDTRRELGGSEYWAQRGLLGSSVPQVRAQDALRWYRALHGCIQNGWVRSAHDCSDGGLAVALAESAFAGGLGLDLRLDELARGEGLAPFELLFSESPSRLVVTVSPAHAADFERLFAGQACAWLGEVTPQPRMLLRGGDGSLWVDAALADLKEAWQATLRDL
jgi:phosphoribosylformylglycinamidine synthase